MLTINKLYNYNSLSCIICDLIAIIAANKSLRCYYKENKHN